MNPVDERASDWRARQAALEAQAKEARAQKRRRQVSIRMSAGMPAWQRWIIYPIGFWMLAECFRVVFLGGRMR